MHRGNMKYIKLSLNIYYFSTPKWLWMKTAQGLQDDKVNVGNSVLFQLALILFEMCTLPVVSGLSCTINKTKQEKFR